MKEHKKSIRPSSVIIQEEKTRKIKKLTKNVTSFCKTRALRINVASRNPLLCEHVTEILGYMEKIGILSTSLSS